MQTSVDQSYETTHDSIRSFEMILICPPFTMYQGNMNFEETKNNHASFNVNNVTRHGLSGEKGGLRGRTAKQYLI